MVFVFCFRLIKVIIKVVGIWYWIFMNFKNWGEEYGIIIKLIIRKVY